VNVELFLESRLTRRTDFASIRKSLQGVAEAGFDGVLISGHCLADPGLLCRAVREVRLPVSHFHIPADLEFDPTSPDETRRKASLRLMEKKLDQAAQLETKVAVFHLSARFENTPGILQKRSRYFQELMSVWKRAKALGVRLAVENLSFPANQKLLQRFFAWDTERNFGFCYDSGHQLLSKEKASILERFGDRLQALHLNDNDGVHDDHLLPGDGILSMPRLGAALRKWGCRRLELEACLVRPPYTRLAVRQRAERAFRRATSLARFLSNPVEKR